MRVHVDLTSIEGVEVVSVEVPAAQMVTATNGGKYLRRAMGVKGEPECIPMAPHEVISRAGSIGEQDFSHAAMASVTIDDLESEEFDRMRWLAVACQPLPTIASCPTPGAWSAPIQPCQS